MAAMVRVCLSILLVSMLTLVVRCFTILKPDKNGGGSHGYEFRKPVNRMALDDVITADKTDIGYVDIDWDIIQQEKDKLINFASDIKDDVITDMEVEGTDDIFQAAEDTPATSLNLHVMAVVDSQLFRKFLSRNQDDVRQTHNAIVLYFSMIFAMVNERFQTMRRHGLDIAIKLAAIVIEERDPDSPWVRGHVRRPAYTSEAMVDVESALRDFTTWLQSSGLPEYDHAVGFTGYTLVKNSRKIDGLAYMSKVCDRQGRSSSIVGENGDFMSIGVVAHEIAHSLGASHDGSGGGNCSADDNYIMAPRHQMNPKKVKNLLQFSSCTSSQILQHFRSEAPQCLYDDNHDFRYSYDLDLRPPGEVITRDTQCKLVFGDNSTLCHYITSSSDTDVFCSNVWCHNPTHPSMCQTKARLVTLPGTNCGENKICRKGNCVLKEIQIESCSGGTEDEVYCRTLLDRQGEQACQFAAVRRVCCRTCAGRGRDNQQAARK
eukprot:XP_011418026.1 PREDICTED: ADAM family mig-17-like [Crassostrea gigas]